MSRHRARLDRLAREQADRQDWPPPIDPETRQWAERLGVTLPTDGEVRAMPPPTEDEVRQWCRDNGVYVEGIYDPNGSPS